MLQPTLDLTPPPALVAEARTLLTSDVLGDWQRLADMSHTELREALRHASEPARLLLTIMRKVLQPAPQSLQISQPATLAGWLMADMSHLEQEELRVVLLDRQNYIIDVVTIYIGNVGSIHIRVAELFKPAIARQASAIMLVHNHPTGSACPSPDDLTLTRKVLDAGKLLNIDLLDHLVIGKGQWTSMRERRMGW